MFIELKINSIFSYNSESSTHSSADELFIKKSSCLVRGNHWNIHSMSRIIKGLKPFCFIFPNSFQLFLLSRCLFYCRARSGSRLIIILLKLSLLRLPIFCVFHPWDCFLLAPTSTLVLYFPQKKSKKCFKNIDFFLVFMFLLIKAPMNLLCFVY